MRCKLECVLSGRTDRNTELATLSYRYLTLLDNINFMPAEHIQKEKEYGIPWRTSFKKELRSIVDHTRILLVGEDAAELRDTEDPFDFLHRTIKKKTKNAASFNS